MEPTSTSNAHQGPTASVASTILRSWVHWSGVKRRYVATSMADMQHWSHGFVNSSTRHDQCWRGHDNVCDERSEELELPRLEDRRTRGDMILTYRLINGEEGINYRNFFTLDERPYGLREQHTKKISRGQEDCELRRYLFSKRVIDKWNKLTEEEVSAPSTSEFKRRYAEAEKLRQQRIRASEFVPW